MTWSLDEVSNQNAKVYVTGGLPGTKKREVTLCDRCVVFGNHGFGRITGPWRTKGVPSCEGDSHGTNNYVANVTTKSALEQTVQAWNNNVDSGGILAKIVCESPLEIEIYEDDGDVDTRLGFASGMGATLLLEKMQSDLSTATKLKKVRKR